MFVLVGILVLILTILIARKIYYRYDPKALPVRYAYDNMGGWLVLVAIGMVIRPLLFMATLLTLMNTPYQPEIIKSIKNTVYTFIWLPYFVFSDRVKETFVNRYQKEDNNIPVTIPGHHK